jgi:hypothetical protein
MFDVTCLEDSEPDVIRKMQAGVPVGFPLDVTMRNNHLQYIVTWSVAFKRLYSLSSQCFVFFSCRYSLSLITGVMTFTRFRKGFARRI